MSDSLATFLRKNDAQFAKADHELIEITITWATMLFAEVIDTTPGPNLQYPHDTEYIATGRLRGSFRYGWNYQPVASRWDGGPYTEHGQDTLAAAEEAIRSRPIAALSYFQSDVGYGEIVHEGGGRHTIARPWVGNAGRNSETLLIQARAKVMGR